jgi:hypothetical protein
LFALLALACAQEAAVPPATSESPFVTRLERGAGATTPESVDDKPRMPRELAFEMAGFAAHKSDHATAEERAAVMQAAVIDALAKALIEARRARGQTTSDFTAKLGPRLTVVHRPIGDGYEVQLSLIARGVDTTFVVQDGVLQHPPHELKLLHQVFEQTNGEFSLLSAEWNALAGGCAAKVACYRPAALETKLAGDPVNETVSAP